MFRVPSISGLFKWRQFEPEVILLAVGWYLRFFTFVSRRGRVARRARPARRSRHGVAMGSALRPGSQSAPTLKAQTDQRQLAGGRDLHSGEWQPALTLPGGGFFRRDPRLPSLGQTGRGRSRALSDQSA